LLRDIATRPDWYFFAPDSADLSEIYQRVAVTIPCPQVWP
jgi:hypothetical protein